MIAVCVDDEPMALNDILYNLDKIPQITEGRGFLTQEECMKYLGCNSVDIVFLDINMGQNSGLAFAEHLKKVYPQIAIVFLTGYSQYAVEAFKVRAEGYLLKPAAIEDIEEELTNIQISRNTNDFKVQIYIQTFGNFEIFIHQKPLVFPRSKAKEILAYLVDRRGASATSAEIASVLWDERGYRCH